ncbi:MAG: hypothetical protein AAGH15_07330 [Myxococcota bacterium]
MLLAFAPYGLGLLRGAVPSTRATLLLAGLAALPALLAPPLSSDDLYRYLWDGRVLGEGMDPYAFAPADPALAELRDGLWRRINNPEIGTIYPPVAQVLFALADALAHHPVSMKALALLGHGAATLVAARVGGPQAAFAFGLNPLALEASALGGHVDVFVGLAVLAFARAASAGRWARASLALVLAAGLKVAPAVLWPQLARRHRGLALLSLVGLVAVLVPLAGGGRGGGASAYATRWRGNAGLYGAVEGLTRAGLEASFGTAPGRVRVPDGAHALEGTPLDPLAALARPKKDRERATEVDVALLSEPAARVLVGLLFLGVLGWILRRERAPGDAALATLLAVLLLAPQLHPWYLLWVLPLAAAEGRLAPLAWSATLFVAYAPLDGWVLGHVWREAPVAVPLAHALGLVALALERRRAGAAGTC